jgi:type VI secretion system protein ImpC
MEDWLNRWLAQYVEPDWRNAADEAKARRPLLEARVKITEPQDRPGYVICELFLLPYYQLEGLTAPLRLTTRLPSPVRRK